MRGAQCRRNWRQDTQTRHTCRDHAGCTYRLGELKSISEMYTAVGELILTVVSKRTDCDATARLTRYAVHPKMWLKRDAIWWRRWGHTVEAS